MDDMHELNRLSHRVSQLERDTRRVIGRDAPVLAGVYAEPSSDEEWRCAAAIADARRDFGVRVPDERHLMLMLLDAGGLGQLRAELERGELAAHEALAARWRAGERPSAVRVWQAVASELAVRDRRVGQPLLGGEVPEEERVDDP